MREIRKKRKGEMDLGAAGENAFHGKMYKEPV